MLRSIFAFIVCLATMFGVIYFVAMGRTTMDLLNAYILWTQPWTSPTQVTAFWSNVKLAIFDYLIRPYTLATEAQLFVPIAALSLAGFISGLITKHPFRAIIIGIICSFLVVIGYFVWSISDPLSWNAIIGILTGVSGWDYALLFGLPAGLGMIGGLITREW
ncbi:MAG: hypothetical protein ACTSP1_00930 [Candidatus Freyarchaeota archaeon]|nr:hypothetical protein [Candidatus Freyarchaeota archaeon]